MESRVIANEVKQSGHTLAKHEPFSKIAGIASLRSQ